MHQVARMVLNPSTATTTPIMHNEQQQTMAMSVDSNGRMDEGDVKHVQEFMSKISTIDRNLDQLTSLQAKCDPCDSASQKSIRALENQIVRLFSQQVVSKKKITNWEDIEQIRSYPMLAKWLLAIGIDSKCTEVLTDHYDEMEEFLNADDEEIKMLIFRGFNLAIEDEMIDAFEDVDDLNLSEASIKMYLQQYVRDYVSLIHRAQHCLQTCVETLMNGQDLSTLYKELYWDSWSHWILHLDPDKASVICAAIAEASKKASTRNLPKPLPPLPALKTSRLISYRANGENNSKSTGSSPLSPPAPPLSAGITGHRFNLSNSSSSSSIIPSGFYNPNLIVDPNHVSSTNRRQTPPPTPPVVHHKKSFIFSSTSIFSNSRNSERKFPTTPPPIRRHQTTIYSGDQFPLTKSKSHEEHLSNRIEPLDPVIANKLLKKYNTGNTLSAKANKNNKHNSLDNLRNVPLHQRRRLATEPGSIGGSTSPILTSSNCSSPIAISPDNQAYIDRQSDSCFLDSTVPRSPQSTGMLHSIHHRFVNTMKINTVCNVCEKQMFFGFKCRDCKYYCHKDCQDKVPNSCGLPKEFITVFKQTLSGIKNRSSSPVVSHKSLSSSSFSHRTKSQMSNYPIVSSHSSSNPSSPALFNHNASSSSSAAISPTNSNNSKNSFQFQFPPDINVTTTPVSSEEDTGIYSDTNALNDEENQANFTTIQEEEETSKTIIESDKSFNSLVTSGSSGDSIRTVTERLDSQDSQADASDMDHGDHGWPRQNSVTMKEWDIPYDELILEEEIGSGRFGAVFRGKWHGSVAIKRLNLGKNVHEDRKALETFRQEVGIFRKTRHDNLVLFMGACMKPPHLAIVTSLCKGLTLHTHIHVRHDKFNLNRTILIAEQICLGMGYLHARDIVHKDLKTKNIFYENGKVIITDFGLSAVSKLCVTNRRGDWLTVPKGWLCYLAPEIIRTLCIHSQDNDNMPFSFATDIYAFGTVWYELLFGMWPFSGQPSEVIIWQVGKGIKQPINNFQASKEVKDLLFLCWAYKSEVRPDFSTLYDYLEKLPKKRLQRSPSHPAQLHHTSEQAYF